MRYFFLRDDVHVPGRRYLGDLCMADGATVHLLNGRRLELAAPVTIEVTQEGRPLPFCFTAFAAPVAQNRLAEAMAEIAKDRLEVLEARVGGERGFAALNATTLIACVDEARSQFTKWTTADHRADLAGEYRSIPKLHVAGEAIPPDVHLFRVAGWSLGLVVSETMKDAMELIGCLGAKFVDVT